MCVISMLNLVRNLDVSAWDVAARTSRLPTWLVVTHPTVKYQGFRKLFPSSSKVFEIIKTIKRCSNDYRFECPRHNVSHSNIHGRVINCGCKVNSKVTISIYIEM
ncbi:uncharacterized protein LOC122566052 [Bombus pyrosoma]|uniref:uncharacterized protein LOC122566052 n=1 Tax=Bombus pyrosoma TaxID=396416 RepID=UPI001CB96A8E|nr:uncharacterized protein LOC122566052 [Bombus pyrosoma]